MNAKTIQKHKEEIIRRGVLAVFYFLSDYMDGDLLYNYLLTVNI